MNSECFPQNPPERCWQSIGVWGDHSCDRLGEVIHCQNCHVYTVNGRKLFERPAPSDYLEEWSRILATEREEIHQERKSIVTFRTGDEWFGLITASFMEVHHFRSIHRIPHCSNPALLGLTNIRGSLLLCISLRPLLSQNTANQHEEWKRSTQETRLAVVERDGKQWVCKMDEIDGIHQYSESQLKAPPVNIAKASQTFTRGLIFTEEKTISLLDEELLFHYFKNQLT